MTWNQDVEDTLGTRAAALAFMDGVSSGWYHAEFTNWHARDLQASGRLRTSCHQGPSDIIEPGVGRVALIDDLWELPLRSRLDTIARLFLAMVSAHTRVLTALRGLVTSQRVDFVQNAYQARRLFRTRQGLGWRVDLGPDDSLSDCVLALFAADYLNHSEEYLRGLGVCRHCGRIRFGEEQRFRTLCDFHGSQWLAHQRRVLLSRGCVAGGAAAHTDTGL
jgi:hypothetical protein